MITLVTGSNTIKFDKYIEDTTPSVVQGSVYHIVTYQTLANDTDSAGITYTTAVNESNPRWTKLQFTISSSTEYTNGIVEGLPGTTYDLEIWYGPIIQSYVWGAYSETWSGTPILWNDPSTATYEGIVATSELRYKDRIFVSSSVEPNEIVYNSSNEVGRFIVYQG